MVLEKYYSKEIDAEQLLKGLEEPLALQRMFRTVEELIRNNIFVEKYESENGIVTNVESYAVVDYITKILAYRNDGYIIHSEVLNAADFGAPQKRKRFILIGVRKDLKKEALLPSGEVKPTNYTTVRDAIEDLSQYTPYLDIEKDKGIQLSRDISSISSFAQQLRKSNKILYNHVITKTKDAALKRFASLRPGENFHDLDVSLKENTYTDISRTQNTIYLRLNYDTPSGTVVNVRKSMWIHPTVDRAISIREAARLQTFPDDYVFEGSKDSQYQQVGNAVPPILAKEIAMQIIKMLKD
jgi:DNA (cytosine-5)-methyltransferase 1